MHIVDVAEFYAPLGGGVKTYVDAKIGYAHRRGATVTVIAPGPEDRVEPRDGGQVIYLKAPAIPMDRRYHIFWDPKRIHALLETLRPDVVEASSPFRGAWIVSSWRSLQASRVIKSLFMHADPIAAHPQIWLQRWMSAASVDRMLWPGWRYLARTAAPFDRVVVGSRWFGQRILRHGGIASDFVPLGIDTDLFHPQRRDPELRRQLLAGFGLGPEARLLVGVGRHHPEKQWPVIFQAVGALRDERVAMIQIGHGFDHARVERAAAAAGNVRLLGQITDREQLASLVASADAMVHGSRAETFGLVVSEGLASGIPLILPAEGGCTDVADPAWSETYAPGNSGAATAAIHRLLSRDPGRLRLAAIGARYSHIATPAEHFDRLFRLYGSDFRRSMAAEPVVATMATPARRAAA